MILLSCNGNSLFHFIQALSCVISFIFPSLFLLLCCNEIRDGLGRRGKLGETPINPRVFTKWSTISLVSNWRPSSSEVLLFRDGRCNTTNGSKTLALFLGLGGVDRTVGLPFPKILFSSSCWDWSFPVAFFVLFFIFASIRVVIVSRSSSVSTAKDNYLFVVLDLDQILRFK